MTRTVGKPQKRPIISITVLVQFVVTLNLDLNRKKWIVFTIARMQIDTARIAIWSRALAIIDKTRP